MFKDIPQNSSIESGLTYIYSGAYEVPQDAPVALATFELRARTVTVTIDQQR